MTLRPLAETEVAAALAAAIGRAAERSADRGRRGRADGSVARALAFLDEDALALRQRALDQLDRLPALDASALHALGEALAGTDPQPLAAFVDTVNAWLSQRLDRGRVKSAALVRLAEALGAHQSGRPRRGNYNLERKPLVFSVFGLLAEATRG